MKLLEELPVILKEAKKDYEKCKADAFEITCKYGKISTSNIVAEGDNLKFMKFLTETMNMKGKVNLIYVDPPFFTKLKYEAVINVPEKGEKISVPAYTDKWENGERQYFKMLAARLYAMHDLLAEEGCLWVHLDWHISHYIKVMLDEIFGYDNFVNEVVWTYKSGGSSKRHFARKHDNLLFYGKSKKYYFSVQKEKSYNRELKPYKFKGVEEFCDDTGWYTMVNMKDVWNIDMVGRTSKERTGYATQKPEALIERLLTSCSKEGDICADFFAGSGTLATVAGKLKRNFITCDGGKLACSICFDRLAEENIPFNFIGVMDKKEVKSENELGIEVVYEEDKCLINVDRYIKGLRENENAVKFWSIDWNYNGKEHNTNKIYQMTDTVATEKAGERISIVFTDIIGRRKQYIINTGGNIK